MHSKNTPSIFSEAQRQSVWIADTTSLRFFLSLPLSTRAIWVSAAQDFKRLGACLWWGVCDVWLDIFLHACFSVSLIVARNIWWTPFQIVCCSLGVFFSIQKTSGFFLLRSICLPANVIVTDCNQKQSFMHAISDHLLRVNFFPPNMINICLSTSLTAAQTLFMRTISNCSFLVLWYRSDTSTFQKCFVAWQYQCF